MTPDDLDPDELAVTLHERALAILLGALLRQDLTADVDLAWRVAEMVASLDPTVPPDWR